MGYFPVDYKNGRNDGTEDLMVVYERLAIRDATWCKPHRKSEYMSMGGEDMIRNLLLGSFTNGQDVKKFYGEYWLPLEKLTADKHGRSLKQLLEDFLEVQRLQVDEN